MKRAKKETPKVLYPINHWSTSSMIDFLSNPLIFKKKWIALIPDEDSSMSAMIGKACHLALETIFGGNEEVPVPPDVSKAIPLGIQAGLDWLDKQNDNYIRYGKTGDRATMLSKYAKAIAWYTNEMPEFDVVTVEEKMQHHLKSPEGIEYAIPMKGKSDLVVRKPNGRLRIIDHKFVSSYTDPDEESAIKIIQAMFLYHLVKAEHGEEPEDIVYRECKTSENKDGTVQVKEYGIEYAKVPHYHTIFYRLYDDCTKALARPDVVFLPNVRDNMNGTESWMLYQQNLLGIDMSDVEIDHNTHHVRYMPKQTKFADSTLATVDSDSFLPEERVRIKLGEFGIPVKPREVHHGASVTLYTLEPSRGVPVKTIEKHKQDIALALRAESVRIIAPIPGTNLIGIEVPRVERDTVPFDDSMLAMGTLEVPIGVDLYGKVIRKDLSQMPHLLVAGATGSGKSVFTNVVIEALTKQNDPKKMQMVLIDPKQVELARWATDEHTRGEIVNGVADAVKTLASLAVEMEARYTTLKNAGVKSIAEYGGDMPYLVVVIDEFADLIMSREKIKVRDVVSNQEHTQEVAGKEIETSVVRLAQKGRAAGIHLIIGTQRPSVNVLTGLIKANMPTRIAFMCSSSTDSKVILDTKGAEELLGRGDMLFMNPSERGLQRLQGFFIE